MVFKHHFAWLDVLRSVAMLEVLSSHYRNVLLPSYEVIADASKCCVAPLYALTRWGHGAVIIFFVLSGFLVGGKTIERAFRNEFDLKAFIVNRVERIMIPLALMCLIVPLVFYGSTSRLNGGVLSETGFRYKV